MLAERCVDKSLDSCQIINVDFDDMYLIDKNGHWQRATIDDIQSAIKDSGVADIVMKCEMDDPSLSMKSDLEYHEITGVKDFIIDGDFIAIETDEMILCTDDIYQEISNERNDRGIPETGTMEFINWRDAHSWDGNSDPRFVEDGPSFFDNHDFDDGPILE